MAIIVTILKEEVTSHSLEDQTNPSCVDVENHCYNVRGCKTPYASNKTTTRLEKSCWKNETCKMLKNGRPFCLTDFNPPKNWDYCYFDCDEDWLCFNKNLDCWNDHLSECHGKYALYFGRKNTTLDGDKCLIKGHAMDFEFIYDWIADAYCNANDNMMPHCYIEVMGMKTRKPCFKSCNDIRNDTIQINTKANSNKTSNIDNTVYVLFTIFFWLFVGAIYQRNHKSKGLHYSLHLFDFILSLKLMKFYRSKWVKIFLIAQMNAALIMTGRQIKAEWVKLARKEITTSFTTHLNDTMQLPDILACLNIRYNGKKLSNFTKYQFTLIEGIHMEGRTFNFYSLQAQSNMLFNVIENHLLTNAEWIEITEISNRGALFMKSFVQNYSFKCSDFVDCPDYDCCKSASYYNTLLGRCTLLPSAPMNYNPNKANERTIEFTIPQNSSAGAVPSTPYNNGLILRFRNPQNKQFDAGYFHVSGGYHTFITIRKLSHIKMIQNCNPIQRYDVFECAVKCIGAVADKCNCTSVDSIQESDITNTTTLCMTIDKVDCLTNKLFEAVSQSNDSNVLSNCSSRCPLPCDRWSYDIYFTFAKLRNNSYKPWNGSDNPNAVLSIGYENNIITSLIEGIYYTPSDFISNVGGILGVWFSASWLTVVQFGIAMILVFKYLVSTLILENLRRRRIKQRMMNGTQRTFI